MSCVTFCTCDVNDCPAHPRKHGDECAPCIEKNLKHHEIPYCFWNKIGETGNADSPYSFLKFAKAVIDGENP